MVGADFPLHRLQSFLELRQGKVQLSGRLINHSQVVLADERIGIFGTECRAIRLPSFLRKLHSEVELRHPNSRVPGSSFDPVRNKRCAELASTLISETWLARGMAWDHARMTNSW